MKLIHQFTDSRSNITNKIFETKYGPKLVHSINPGTNEFVISFIFKGGSNIEELLGVTSGTAHFAEHILAGNPNKRFKTYEERESFVSGNSKRPKVYSNAVTSKNYMRFYVRSNECCTERSFEYLKACLDYPLENISKYIEKERGIILAEKNRKVKDIKNSEIPFYKFIFPDSNFLHRYNLGTIESIKKISVEDIKKYIKESITLKNLSISIQSNKDLSNEELDNLNKLLAVLRKGKDIDFPNTNDFNKTSFDCFHSDDIEGTEISFNFLEEKLQEPDYKKFILEKFLRMIFNKLTFDVLREKESLIYSNDSTLYSHISYNHYITSFEYVVSSENISKFLDKYKIFLEKDFPNFLKTNKCKEMFEDIKSNYIFPLTETYNPFYPDGIIEDIVNKNEPYEYDKAKEVAEKITLDEVIEYLPNFFAYKPTKIWIESPLPKEEITKIVEESSVYKYYKSLPTTTTRTTSTSSRKTTTTKS